MERDALIAAAAILDAAPVRTTNRMVRIYLDEVVAVVEDEDDFLAGVQADELPSACTLENGACESCQ